MVEINTDVLITESISTDQTSSRSLSQVIAKTERDVFEKKYYRLSNPEGT